MMVRSSRKGFSLIETLIATALVGMLILILMSVENLFHKEKNRLTSRLENSIDTLVGERTIYLDLRGIAPSFNNLKLADDRGNLFFDYFSDVPETFIGKDKRDRQFTLEAGKNVFYFLYQDPEAGALLNFDPVAAYEIGPVPADFNIPATLAYKSVNQNNWISSQRPNFWRQDRLLFFDTNVFVRSSVPLNMAEAPSSPSFLGAVDPIANQVTGTALMPYLKNSYNNPDTFLRELKPRGGGQPVVKVRAVRFYRYYLQAYADERIEGTPARLIRDEYVNGKFEKPHMISDRVNVVRFSRESVMNKVVRFSIEKLKDKNTR